MNKDTDPVLRADCQWCDNRKHCVQYRGVALEHPGTRVVETLKPCVARVCPICDSPGAAILGEE